MKLASPAGYRKAFSLAALSFAALSFAALSFAPACDRHPAGIPQALVEEARLRGVEIFRPGDRDPLGSGLLLGPGGLVLTSFHLLRVSTDPATNALQEIVVSHDGTTGPATLLRGEAKLDLALLHWRMPPEKLVEMQGLADLKTDRDRWAPRGELRPGEAALLVGSAYGLPGSVLVGSIAHTARLRTDPVFYDIPLVQTAGLSYPGCSGGAVFLADGRIAGINRATFGFAPGTGIGLVIPSGYVLAFLDDFAKNDPGS